MDEQSKQKLIFRRSLLKKNAPLVYKTFVSRKLMATITDRSLEPQANGKALNRQAKLNSNPDSMRESEKRILKNGGGKLGALQAHPFSR